MQHRKTIGTTNVLPYGVKFLQEFFFSHIGDFFVCNLRDQIFAIYETDVF